MVQSWTYSLKTTWRDVRVTDHTPANGWLARKSTAVDFAAAICRRFARYIRILSSNVVLRRAHARAILHALFRHFHINVAPSFERISQPVEHYRIVERRTENRVLPHTDMRLAATPAVERIVERSMENRLLLHSNLRPMTVSVVERILHRLAINQTPYRTVAHADTGIQRPEANSLPLLLSRPAPVSFAPVDMVLHQPRRGSFVSTEPVSEIDPARPRVVDWPTGERQGSAPSTESINLKQLTEQVVEALDRRLVANHERLTRRS